MTPLVSIIIPVYNGSNYLEEAIKSALNQTYKNIEVIVINDGSDDNGATENIALKYKDYITYYYKPNGGVSSALNLGIKKMNGEYFSWLSHDDLYDVRKIELQVKMLNTYNSNTIIATKSALINKNSEIIRKSKKNQKTYFNSKELFKRIHQKSLNGCSLLIKKKWLEEVGCFDEKYYYKQDFVTWVKLSLINCSLVYVNEILTYSRVHINQSTNRIKYRNKLETKTYVSNYFNSKSRNNARDQVLIKYSIKNGLWKDIKHYIDKTKKIKYFFYYSFLRGYFYGCRLFKKTYWKIIRK